MEKEYIERGALLEELQEEIDFESTMYTEEQNKWLRAGLSIAARDVRNQPTADVVPREEYEALQINLKTVRYELRSLKTRYEELHYKYQIAVSDGYNKLIVELKEKHTKGGGE